VAVGYYLAPRRMQWWVLLAASVAFYAWAGWAALIVMAADVLAAYAVARLMGREFEREKARAAGAPEAERRRLRRWHRARRKLYLTLFLLAALGALAATKYFNFFVALAARLLEGLGARVDAPRLNWAAPLGISYCTLSLIGYAADVFWGRLAPERNPARLMLFALFFPAVTIGPILRYREIADALFRERRYDARTVRFGAQLMVWGYFKKLVVAENLAPLVDQVYGSWAAWGPSSSAPPPCCSRSSSTPISPAAWTS